MATTLKLAPKIVNNGKKQQKCGDENLDWGTIRTNRLERILFNNIPTKNAAELKVMLVLTGQAEGFRVPQTWIEAQCGISHSAYINARKALVARGWLTHEDDYISVNYDEIYKYDV